MRRRVTWLAGALGLACGLFAGGSGCTLQESHEAADPGELARFRMPDGPLEEVRIRRDTRGGLVVSGFTFFPEHTRLSLVLYGSGGDALARTQAEVVNSLFQALPLAPSGGGTWPAGEYALAVEAVFAPGAQPERVLRASRDGTVLAGEGMTTTVQGRPAFSKRFPFALPGEGGD